MSQRRSCAAELPLMARAADGHSDVSRTYGHSLYLIDGQQRSTELLELEKLCSRLDSTL